MTIASKLAALVLSFGAAFSAQNQCRFYLVNHTDGVAGVILSLETATDSSGKCQLNSVNLRLVVGDGSTLHHADAAFAWQSAVVYTVKAVITVAGPQQLSIDGQPGAESLFFERDRGISCECAILV